MTTTKLSLEINSLPLNLRQEVEDFVAFLKTKNQDKQKLKTREFGFAKNKIKLADDFDEPLEMFNKYI